MCECRGWVCPISRHSRYSNATLAARVLVRRDKLKKNECKLKTYARSQRFTKSYQQTIYGPQEFFSFQAKYLSYVLKFNFFVKKYVLEMVILSLLVVRG